MSGEPQSLMAVEPDPEQEPAPPSSPRLQVLSERPAPAPRRAASPLAATAPAREQPSPLPASTISAADLAAIHRAQRVAAALGTFDAIARVLSVRVLLLLSVASAFALAIIAARTSDLAAGATFAGFCVLVVNPLIWLDHTTRRPPGG